MSSLSAMDERHARDTEDDERQRATLAPEQQSGSSSKRTLGVQDASLLHSLLTSSPRPARCTPRSRYSGRGAQAPLRPPSNRSHNRYCRGDSGSSYDSSNGDGSGSSDRISSFGDASSLLSKAMYRLGNEQSQISKTPSQRHHTRSALARRSASGRRCSAPCHNLSLIDETEKVEDEDEDGSGAQSSRSFLSYASNASDVTQPPLHGLCYRPTDGHQEYRMTKNEKGDNNGSNDVAGAAGAVSSFVMSITGTATTSTILSSIENGHDAQHRRLCDASIPARSSSKCTRRRFSHEKDRSSSSRGSTSSISPQQQQLDIFTSNQTGLRCRHGRLRRGSSSLNNNGAGGSLHDRSATAGASRTPNAPLSRRPVVTWRSYARVCAIASVPAGQVLTGGDVNGAIEVWDGRTGWWLCDLNGHQAPVLSLLAIPHTTLLLSGSADRTARLWELQTLQSTMVLQGHRGVITALATLWMPDVGLNLFTGSDDGTVRQWRAATGACVHVYTGHCGPINVVASLRPMKYVATGGCDGMLKLWNTQTLRCVSSIVALPAHRGTASSSDTSTAINSTGQGHRQGIPEGSMMKCKERDHNSNNNDGAVWDIVQMDDRDQSIAVATDDGTVRLWAFHWGQHVVLLKEFFLPGVLLKARCGARCLLACGTHLCVGSARGELYLWNTGSLPYTNSVLSRSGASRTSIAAVHRVSPLPSTSPTAVSIAGVALEGEESDAQSGMFDATLLFHTAAITGLTRQGSQLWSGSLDHTVCRWDMRGVMQREGDPTLNFMEENGMGVRLALNGEEGWASPFSWALRPSLGWAWGAGPKAGGGRQGVRARFTEDGVGSGDGRGGDMGLSPLYPHKDQQQQQPTLLQPAANATLSPLALLRNPKNLLESGTAAVMREEGGAAEFAFTELSPSEAAAAYTELPLTFLVAHLRSAAAAPVDVRTVAKVLLLFLYVVFFVGFYSVGLAPLLRYSNDITDAFFSQTANYPLPSFAQPHTFASITSPVLLERWLLLMLDQLSSLSVPIKVDLPAVVPALHRRGEPPDTAMTTADVSNFLLESHNKNHSDSRVRTDSVHSAEGISNITSLVLPAMPGGVVLLRHIRLRVKHVTSTSCRWNSHLIRRSLIHMSAARLPCYGELRPSTESRETLCFDVNASLAETNLAGLSGSTRVRCLPYTEVNAGLSFKGLFYRYNTGGYVVNLPFHAAESDTDGLNTLIEVMRRVHLIDDQRTRLVDALLFTYHLQTQTFVRLHYVLEVPRGGVWITSTSTSPCPLFHVSTSVNTKMVLACVVLMLLLLLLLFSLLLYDMAMASYVGKLLPFFCSVSALVDIASLIISTCVVSFFFRWLVLSSTVDTTKLLRASIPHSPTIEDFLGNGAPPEYSEQVHRLSKVATVFHRLTACAAVEAVLLFLMIAITVSRLITLTHFAEAAMRQLRVQLIITAAMMVLAVVPFALAFHLLFGARHYAYTTVGRSVWHLLLYFVASQSVDASPLVGLTTDRQVIGKLLLFILNYMCRLFFSVYVVSLVVVHVQAVARETPHIPIRALLVKWWYDVQVQIALMRQRTRGTALRGSHYPAAAETTTQEGEREGNPQELKRSALRSFLSTNEHRQIVIEHVWRRLNSLQQEQEEAQKRRQKRGAATSASPIDGVQFVHVRLRLTDLLLLLSEDERTPFAGNAICHVWGNLAWMYHYHQQHTQEKNPEEEKRQARLDAGIYGVHQRLEPLFAAVWATQARLGAHEARLRPLAKAVDAMTVDKP